MSLHEGFVNQAPFNLLRELEALRPSTKVQRALVVRQCRTHAACDVPEHPG